MATHTPMHHHNGPHHPHLLPIILIVLLTLGALASAGRFAVDRVFENRRVTALMGPKPHLAPLPAMEIPLGGPRSIDLRVSLVLTPKTRPDAVLRYQDRIADRLFESVGGAGAERLTAPGSAQLLKDAIKDAVRREAGSGLIRDVYIERMVVQ